MDPEQALQYVDQLHRLVDELVAPLEDRHAQRLACKRGCHGCCVDGLTVFALEAELILRRHRQTLAEEPHPDGACAMLDHQGACRIYADRPYVCRTQGLPLRWARDGVEHRDICPLNEADGAPIEALPDEACWTIGPVETRLAAVQEAVDGGRRVALRALFSAASP